MDLPEKWEEVSQETREEVEKDYQEYAGAFSKTDFPAYGFQPIPVEMFYLMWRLHQLSPDFEEEESDAQD